MDKDSLFFSFYCFNFIMTSFVTAQLHPHPLVFYLYFVFLHSLSLEHKWVSITTYLDVLPFFPGL